MTELKGLLTYHLHNFQKSHPHITTASCNEYVWPYVMQNAIITDETDLLPYLTNIRFMSKFTKEFVEALTNGLPTGQVHMMLIWQYCVREFIVDYLKFNLPYEPVIDGIIECD